jgi:hypothetical protein
MDYCCICERPMSSNSNKMCVFCQHVYYFIKNNPILTNKIISLLQKEEDKQKISTSNYSFDVKTQP